MIEHKIAMLEAVLFIENEPLTAEQLSIKCDVDVSNISDMIDTLNNIYRNNMHGIEIIDSQDGYILIPRERIWEDIKQHYQKKTPEVLSTAALETMAIVAYKQPITIGQISAVRGVQSSSMVDLLYEKGLVRKIGRKKAPGSPIEYGTTELFLRYFGISSLHDLPKLRGRDEKLFEITP